MDQIFPLPLQKRLQPWLQTYPEAIAAGLCAGLTGLGWLALRGDWLGLGVWLLLAGYVIGGYSSAREGLTTLWCERELDVDLLMIVAGCRGGGPGAVAATVLPIGGWGGADLDLCCQRGTGNHCHAAH